MSTSPDSTPDTEDGNDAKAPPAAPPPARRGPPKWGVIGFLALLGLFLIVNHLVSTGGPPIAWIEDDLERALTEASGDNRRVFLYLYEPGDPVHRRNESEIFNQYWARQPLSKAVCCRVALRAGDLRRVKYEQKYGYKGEPMFLLLNAAGDVMTPPQSGALDERQFSTFIGRPIEGH